MKPLKVNADYEMELFHNKISSPAVNQSIEFLLFFLSPQPLYSQKKYSPDYLKYVQTVTGVAPRVVGHGGFENFWGSLKNKDVERWWNSKITSTELIVRNGWCRDTHIIRNEQDTSKVNWSRDLLIKDPFGMSGQKFQILRKEIPLSERKELLHKALLHGPLILEPWLNRKYDFSQYVFPDDKIIAYQNQVDEKFQYKGTIFNNYKSASLQDLSFYSKIAKEEWSRFQSQANQIVAFYSQNLNEYGYSIDSFVYEENGELKIRVMTEINYRRTMGRVTYELSEKFSTNCSWTCLLMLKSVHSSPPLWQMLKGIEGLIVLSPGNSRFEILFLLAENEIQGLRLIEKINKLLPDTQLTIKL